MAELEARHWWFLGTRRVLLSELDRCLAAYEASFSERKLRILDLGCGTGFTTRLLCDRGQVIGLDCSQVAFELTRSRAPQAAVLRADASALPLAGASIDIVCGFDMLEHVEDDCLVLEECKRVLCPGGLLMLSVPACPFLWSGHDEALGHFRRYRRADLATRVEQAGLTILRLSHYNALLFPLIASHRLLGRFIAALRALPQGGGPPIRSDLRPVAAPLNALLRGLLGSEQHLLRRGDMPFGISLLLVARAAR